MPYIGNTIRAADDYRLIDDISSGFDGSETSFALQVAGSAPVPFPKSPQQVLISVNGVIQEPDPTGASGFNLVGTNIVFSSAPTNGHAFFGIIYATADYLNSGGNFPSGSLGAPSITFVGDEDTGIYRKSSGSVAFVSNSTEIANTDSNGITISSGSLIVPDSIIHNGDTDTKIRFPAANEFSVETGGTEIFKVSDHVDITGNLDVTGTLSAGNTTNLTGGGPHINFVDSNDNPDFQIGNIGGTLRFQDTTNATTRMLINSDGHIDIAGNLDVGAGVDVTGDLTVSNNLSVTNQSSFNAAVTINSGLFVGGSSVSGGEGGQIELTQAPNSTLAGANVIFDTVDESVRIFESATPFKGVIIDLSTCANSVGSQLLTSTTDATYTGNLTFGSGSTLNLSTNDIYLNARVINNQTGGTDDGLYIGYDNANSGTTKLFGGGGSTNHLVFDNTQFYPHPDNTISIGAASNRYTFFYLTGGVNFSDATGGISYAAGNAANTLDDYEEGTWTPRFEGDVTAGSYTYSAQFGVYTKIGNIVHFQGEIFVTGITSAGAGNLIIRGLPFNANIQYYGTASIGYYTGWAGGYYPSAILKNVNDDRLYLYVNDNVVNTLNATPATITSTTRILFSGTYKTAT